MSSGIASRLGQGLRVVRAVAARQFSKGRAMRVLPAALFAVTILATPGLADADLGSDRPLVGDDLVLRAGFFITDFKTDASVGSDGLFGTFLRLEDELGIDDEDSIFRFDGFYRFNERHGISFGYWAYNREGRVVIDEEIDFDGTEFALGAEIESQFDTNWFRVGWRYRLFGTEKGEAGFNLGLSTYQFDVALEGEANVGMMSTERVRAEDDFIAPIPTVGFFIHYAFSKRFLFSFTTDYFDVEFDEFEGNLLDTSVSIDYFFLEKWGIGLSSNTVDIDVRDSGDDPFSLVYKQSGLFLYLTFAN